MKDEGLPMASSPQEKGIGQSRYTQLILLLTSLTALVFTSCSPWANYTISYVLISSYGNGERVIAPKNWVVEKIKLDAAYVVLSTGLDT